MNENFPAWPGWKTVRLIGRGSFGAVYEIERDVFGTKEKAALKVIRIPQNESEIEEMYDSGYDDASVTATFKQHLQSIVNEYSLMRQMNGAANVVNCDDFRCVPHDNGIGWDIFIRMELLTPLTKAVDRRPSDLEVRRVAEDMCAALSLCRRHGIIHRDIKPQNIFYSPNGDFKLGDFGIAKTIEKTSGGTKIGTYKYMAPEVYAGKPYNLTADIYSLGLVLHWLLNERRSPFLPLPPAPVEASMEEAARMRRFAGESVPTPAHGSDGLKRIVLKACAFDPAERYQSADEMLADLRALDGGQSASERGRDSGSGETAAPAAPADEDATVGSPLRRSPQPQPVQQPKQQPTQQPAQQPKTPQAGERTSPQLIRGPVAAPETPAADGTARQFRQQSGRPQQTQQQSYRPARPQQQSYNPAQPQQQSYSPAQPQQQSYTQQSRNVRQSGGQTPYAPQQDRTRAPQPAKTAAPARDGGSGGEKNGKKKKIVLFSALGALLIAGVILALVFLLPGSSTDKGDWVLIRSEYTSDDGANSVTTYDYDSFGHRSRDAIYYHDTFNGYTEYTCDAEGNVIEARDKWNTTYFENDADGNCVSETHYCTGSDGSLYLAAEYFSGYDSRGRRNAYEYSYFDESGGEYYRYTARYDGYKLVGYTTVENGETSEIRVSQTYDRNGNLTHQENFRQGESTAYYVSDISYDKHGNKTGSTYTRTDEDGSVHGGEYKYQYMRRADIVSAGGYTAERCVHADDPAAVRAGLQDSVWELKDYIFAGWHYDGSAADASVAGDGSVSFGLSADGSDELIEVYNHAEDFSCTVEMRDGVLQRAEISASSGSAVVTPVCDGDGNFTDMLISYSDGSVDTLSANDNIMSLRCGSSYLPVSVYGNDYGSGLSIDFNIRIPDDGRLFLTFESGRISNLNIYDTDFNTVIYFDFPDSEFGGYTIAQMYADVSDEFSVPGVSRVVETRKFSSAGDMIKRSALTYYNPDGKDTDHFGYYADGAFMNHYAIVYDSSGYFSDIVSYDEDGNVID